MPVIGEACESQHLLRCDASEIVARLMRDPYGIDMGTLPCWNPDTPFCPAARLDKFGLRG